MNIAFYNAWHNGDLHVSRTFIRYVIENIKVSSYHYLHNNPRKILQDIPNLQQEKYVFNISNKQGYFKMGDNVYINTWYCSYNNEYLRNKEMTIFVLFNIFKRTLKEVFNHDMLNDPLFFLPKIDYSKFNIDSINKFLTIDKRKKILICNNEVESGQSENFNFDPVIKTLADQYPDILFLISNMKEHIQKNNIIYCNNIMSHTSNLNEISYLSKFCNIIVGRLSGPQSFSTVHDNLLDPNKKFITFIRTGINGYMFGDGSFGVTSVLPEGKRAKFIHTDNFEFENIVNVIKGEIV